MVKMEHSENGEYGENGDNGDNSDNSENGENGENQSICTLKRTIGKNERTIKNNKEQ